MIIRNVQVVARPGREADLSDFLHNQSIALSRRTEGIVSVLPGAARRDTPQDYCFISVWRDMTALRAFVGEDLYTPHISAVEADLVASRSIKHYDLIYG